MELHAYHYCAQYRDYLGNINTNDGIMRTNEPITDGDTFDELKDAFRQRKHLAAEASVVFTSFTYLGESDDSK